MNQIFRFAVPIFFVFGNHDRFGGEDEALRLLAETPIQNISDQVVRYNEHLRFVGLDCMRRVPTHDPIPVLERLPPENPTFTILLSHIPIDFPFLRDYPVDLQLAGHTHSGQIMPFYFNCEILLSPHSRPVSTGTAFPVRVVGNRYLGAADAPRYLE